MILDQLAEHAKERVEADKKLVSFDEMKQKAESMEKGDFSFENTLKNNKVSIISEVKKASPSKGVISEDFPYIEVAKAYEKAGCHCLSVLTEPKWFLGSDQIFQEVRKVTRLPMLRKDFTVDAYQIYQAKVMGADAILLICALLDTETVKNYLKICDDLGISALVETHDGEELESAQQAGARLVGVNNRNLKDFSVDLGNASHLRKQLKKDVIFVAESGISTPEDGIQLVKDGANALLIGEALMRTTDKSAFVSAVLKGTENV